MEKAMKAEDEGWLRRMEESPLSLTRRKADAIRELIEERNALRVALKDAADALELFVDTGAKHREPYETPLSAYDRARAALEPRK